MLPKLLFFSGFVTLVLGLSDCERYCIQVYQEEKDNHTAEDGVLAYAILDCMEEKCQGKFANKDLARKLIASSLKFTKISFLLP
ncbi:hypothetical protein CONCODRAFT_11716 [Conidiobolus coronatus NRRL 28638]|uniref:Extracellular membrane protein CFEM domain-containing protein n=1 Tax=Conidiobolus coronatus (strain ATCC 28846 / CBS 209.66 / NRRL 28638) TaxID=796925 RepID=A0A137NUG6_CONC2|nr:hypothetical protein CONCODRAFT_11716 [Conidiobolus coronatus NRRL 28638]|eukprot:KXN66443.1 hypothetical protein CONCODRAFT_11716 [Conidiobolus coronatus NRRL 28638]